MRNQRGRGYYVDSASRNRDSIGCALRRRSTREKSASRSRRWTHLYSNHVCKQNFFHQEMLARRVANRLWLPAVLYSYCSLVSSLQCPTSILVLVSTFFIVSLSLSLRLCQLEWTLLSPTFLRFVLVDFHTARTISDSKIDGHVPASDCSSSSKQIANG